MKNPSKSYLEGFCLRICTRQITSPPSRRDSSGCSGSYDQAADIAHVLNIS